MICPESAVTKVHPTSISTGRPPISRPRARRRVGPAEPPPRSRREAVPRRGCSPWRPRACRASVSTPIRSGSCIPAAGPRGRPPQHMSQTPPLSHRPPPRRHRAAASSGTPPSSIVRSIRPLASSTSVTLSSSQFPTNSRPSGQSERSGARPTLTRLVISPVRASTRATRSFTGAATHAASRPATIPLPIANGKRTAREVGRCSRRSATRAGRRRRRAPICNRPGRDVALAGALAARRERLHERQRQFANDAEAAGIVAQLLHVRAPRGPRALEPSCGHAAGIQRHPVESCRRVRVIGRDVALELTGAVCRDIDRGAYRPDRADCQPSVRS